MIAKINTADDITNHKNYKLDYEHHLCNLRDPTVQKNISENFQKAEVFEEAFTVTVSGYNAIHYILHY